MSPPERVRTAGDEPVPVVDGVHAAIGRAPFLLRPVLRVLSVALLPWLLAPICVVRGVRTLMASLYVAAFWAWLYLLISLNRLNTHAGPTVPGTRPVPVMPPGWLLAMLATPFLVALLANVRPLSRWFVPCRTVAWSLLWSLPVVFIIIQAAPENTMGSDHSRDQATVRHGTNHLDSGRTFASAATRNGVATRASSHPGGITGTGLVPGTVAAWLVFSRLTLTRR